MDGSTSLFILSNMAIVEVRVYGFVLGAVEIALSADSSFSTLYVSCLTSSLNRDTVSISLLSCIMDLLMVSKVCVCVCVCVICLLLDEGCLNQFLIHHNSSLNDALS